MEICEAPSLPVEKHMIPLLALPALHPHCVRSFLLDIVAREQIWCPDCCGLLGQTLWGGRTLLSPPGHCWCPAEKSGCFPGRNLRLRRELEELVLFLSAERWQSAVQAESPELLWLQPVCTKVSHSLFGSPWQWLWQWPCPVPAWQGPALRRLLGPVLDLSALTCSCVTAAPHPGSCPHSQRSLSLFPGLPHLPHHAESSACV